MTGSALCSRYEMGRRLSVDETMMLYVSQIRMVLLSSASIPSLQVMLSNQRLSLVCIHSAVSPSPNISIEFRHALSPR